MTAAIRLTDQVAMIASGQISLSEEHDCNVYLINVVDGLIMIDAGAGIAPENIAENVESLGYSPKQISHLLLTHGHADHAGGAAYFKAECDLVVCAGSLTASLTAQGDEKGISLDLAKAQGIYPSDYQFQPVEASRILRDGERLRIGGCEVQVFETPGHSADSICFVVEFADGPALFCGDTLFTDGTLPLLNTHDSDVGAYRSSLEKLAAVEAEGLYPGHGLFKIRSGGAVIQQLRERLASSIYLPPVLKG